MQNDIPEAQRQQIPALKQSSNWLLPVSGVAVGLLILGGAGWLLLGRGANRPTSASLPVSEDEATQLISESDILGHRPFEEANSDDLYALQNNPEIKLRDSAAIAFDQMADDAWADGIALVALSGFRTKAEQNALFFEVKQERNQNASQRAEVSAPPGYSEHHTGFAIDIGDADAPETHVEVEFAQTRAFEWLERNAARYSFELSFPEGNEQGVSYEPWHWRFVGDQASLEVFYKGR